MRAFWFWEGFNVPPIASFSPIFKNLSTTWLWASHPPCSGKPRSVYKVFFLFSNPVFKKAFYIVWWYGTNWQNSDASETEIWICIHDIVEQWNPSKPICLKWSQLVMHSLQEFDIFECLLNLTISLRKLKEIKNQIIKVQLSFATFVVQFQESLSSFFIHQESRTYAFSKSKTYILSFCLTGSFEVSTVQLFSSSYKLDSWRLFKITD